MDPTPPKPPDHDHIAQVVQHFYEGHPYPPPEPSLEAYRERWRDMDRRRADYHRRWPTHGFREDRSVLVAGCGTSQAAKYAMRWPDAEVVGIDFSATGVRCTEELKNTYGLANLRLHQLPVERAAELGGRFSLVVCTGVLHHLPDPDKGIRALREVMEVDGAMELMLYAPYGRAGVYMLQEYYRRLGIGTSSAEIRDVGKSLTALPQDHPIVPLLRNSPDFRSEAGLADALLNPQDRSYSVPQLMEYVDRSGLRFGRWIRQAPYLPFCGSVLNSPHQPLLSRLAEAHQFAAMELFRGTMLRHSCVVYRDDFPGQAQPIHFHDEAWLGYVPIRLPGTICVGDRLPPGAAGVLINRGHTSTDIYLPIDGQEKGIFDSIDGRLTVEEILVGHGSRDKVHSLIQRLWWHDQIVFDASKMPQP